MLIRQKIVNILKIIVRFIYIIEYGISYLTSFFVRKKTLIIKEWPGNAFLNSRERLCIFSHFDKHDIIDNYVIYYLESLYNLGCEVIFVSACKTLPDNELNKIKKFCTKIVLRRNKGRDFGGWKIGLSVVEDFKKYNQIILANDSSYGPFSDLKEIFKIMNEKELDMWGITDSWERKYHIQTYFIVFNKRLINSEFFADFWKDVRFHFSKETIINDYEVGLTQRALRQGFKIGAFCDYKELLYHVLRSESLEILFKNHISLYPCNPTHFFWRNLIVDFKCPFIKIELIRDNPAKIKDLYMIEKIIKIHNSGYPIEIIKSHLKRVFKQK